MQIFGAILLLLFVTACGKSNSNAGLPYQKEQVLPVNVANASGLYMARFQTLNPLVNNSIPGSATVQREADKFYAYVKIFGSAPHTWHQQNVYEGRRCPDMSDDRNGDGYIDVEEGKLVWGNVLVPLDANLNTMAAGRNIYPVSDASGTYFYERVSNVRRMYNDLRTQNKNNTGDMIQLDPAKGFDIEGRVVVIQGTDDSLSYPPTVASNDGRSVSQTLPIACGVFSKITKIPGDIEEEDTPRGPVNPTPTTPTTSDTDSDTDSDDDSDDDSDNGSWYDHVWDWWRDRWNRDRGNQPTEWGRG